MITARQITPEHEATFTASLYRFGGTFQLLCPKCVQKMNNYLLDPLKPHWLGRLLQIMGRCHYAGREHP